MGSEGAKSAEGGIDNRTKDNGNTTSIRLADKIHCIRTNNITDDYELKEEIGVSFQQPFVSLFFIRLFSYEIRSRGYKSRPRVSKFHNHWHEAEIFDIE